MLDRLEVRLWSWGESIASVQDPGVATGLRGFYDHVSAMPGVPSPDRDREHELLIH
jgi:hypothetical protein